jgi:pterin-4a-carbinolamine dehydratase
MKANAQDTKAEERFMDRWTLIENGRKLHDQAVFEIFASLFSWMLHLGKGARMAKHAPVMTHSKANA